jgi:hypothetical protein
MSGMKHCVIFTIFEYFPKWGCFQDGTIFLTTEQASLFADAADREKVATRNSQSVKIASSDYSECFRVLSHHYRMVGVCKQSQQHLTRKLGSTTLEQTNICRPMYDYVYAWSCSRSSISFVTMVQKRLVFWRCAVSLMCRYADANSAYRSRPTMPLLLLPLRPPPGSAHQTGHQKCHRKRLQSFPLAPIWRRQKISIASCNSCASWL